MKFNINRIFDTTLKKRIILMITLVSLFSVVSWLILSIIQRESVSAAKLLIDDIGNDLLVSNVQSAERRLEVLRRMGISGLELSVLSQNTSVLNNSSSLGCLSLSKLPIVIDGFQLGELQNCIRVENLVLAIAHSSSALSFLALILFLLLFGWIVRLRMQKVALEKKKSEALVELSSQVAHDIRSPLAALNTMLSQLSMVPDENKVILRQAVNRINDIANTLLKKGRTYDTKNEARTITTQDPIHLFSLIDSILSEKRIQFSNNKISISTVNHLIENVFVSIDATEFSRVLSNLINNSIEAFEDRSGSILINSRNKNGVVQIEIKDNGKGIPESVLKKLGTKGVSHGKGDSESGSGLGIYHAKKTIEMYGGQLEIKSKQDQGTSILINLPVSKTPNWFCGVMNLTYNDVVVVLDDDPSIHSLWDSRIANINEHNIHLIHLYSTKDLETWVKLNNANQYFVDLEIPNQGKTQNGLELIKLYKLQEKATLVTSRFNEIHIQKSAIDLGIKIIPKTILHAAPIEIEKKSVLGGPFGELNFSDSSVSESQFNLNHNQPEVTNPEELFDAVLLDDDLLVHMMWQLKAKETEAKVKLYQNPEELFSELSAISKKSPIYVDNQLSADVRGTDITHKLFQMGYTNIYLSTGSPFDEFKAYTYLKGVVGKTPEW